MRKAKQVMEAERNQVERLLRQGKEDRTIMHELNMNRSAFYACKRRIFKDEAEIFKQQTIEDVAFHSSVLTERLVDLYDMLRRKIDAASNNAKGDMNPSKDYAQTAKVAQEVMINIYKLKTQGIQVANSEFNRSVRRIEGKLLSESTEPGSAATGSSVDPEPTV